jgi:hypothetical protein
MKKTENARENPFINFPNEFFMENATGFSPFTFPSSFAFSALFLAVGLVQ